MVNKTFEDYLRQQFFEEEPTTLDDEFPYKYNDWLETKDVNDILEYAEKALKKQREYILGLFFNRGS